MTNGQRILVIGGILVALIAAVALIFVPRNSGAPASEASSSPADATDTSSTTIPGMQVSGDYTIHEETSSPNTSPDFQASLAAGAKYEQAGNYSAAEKAWLMTTQQWPSDPTAFNNLGNLYVAYLKNYSKAAAAYNKVIQLNPHDTNAYNTLFSIYSEGLYVPSAQAAENILKQGIAANPQALGLQVQLARYYAKQGRTADAKSAYDAAIATANASGNASAAADLEAEKAGL